MWETLHSCHVSHNIKLCDVRKIDVCLLKTYNLINSEVPVSEPYVLLSVERSSSNDLANHVAIIINMKRKDIILNKPQVEIIMICNQNLIANIADFRTTHEWVHSWDC